MPTEPAHQDIDRFVAANVHLCLSSLVSTLASGYGHVSQRTRDYPHEGLIEQAFELARPVEDYEEAARQDGWEVGVHEGVAAWVLPSAVEGEVAVAETARHACEAYGLDPYEREIYEHWAVSEWFAEQLEAKGERVDRDFAGLCIWGRTTTGQAIAMDAVVKAIWRDLHKEEV